MNKNSESTRRITLSEMAPHVHSFLPNENKVNKIVDWLVSWIVSSLASKKIKHFDLLPSKSELASHIGVSLGTMQNAYRIVEDMGYIKSKQRIGTYINDSNSDALSEKLTSKREFAVEILKEHILTSNYQIGDILLSIRKLSEITGIPVTTARMAVQSLVNSNILAKKERNFEIISLNFNITNIAPTTLVEKTALNIKKYILENHNPGDKLPPNSVLMKIFQVSAKTVHDAIRILVKEEMVYTLRGKYGTIVLGDNQNTNGLSIYCYEKIEQKLKSYIAVNYNIGDKLPPTKQLAIEFNTGEKTIKRALNNLGEEGYLTFSRGRYGGTFVMDLPQTSGEAYKWLAISSDYVSN